MGKKGIITMANYIGTFRSSYFRVENEDAYESLKHHLVVTDDDVEFWNEEKDEEIYHGFGGYGDIVGYVENVKAYEDCESDEEQPDYDRFMKELSKIIKEGNACIIMSAGHEKLRYVSGDVVVIIKNHVEYDSLEHRAKEIMKNHGIDPSSVDMYY